MLEMSKRSLALLSYQLHLICRSKKSHSMPPTFFKDFRPYDRLSYPSTLTHTQRLRG